MSLREIVLLVLLIVLIVFGQLIANRINKWLRSKKHEMKEQMQSENEIELITCTVNNRNFRQLIESPENEIDLLYENLKNEENYNNRLDKAEKILDIVYRIFEPPECDKNTDLDMVQQELYIKGCNTNFEVIINSICRLKHSKLSAILFDVKKYDLTEKIIKLFNDIPLEKDRPAGMSHRRTGYLNCLACCDKLDPRIIELFLKELIIEYNDLYAHSYIINYFNKTKFPDSVPALIHALEFKNFDTSSGHLEWKRGDLGGGGIVEGSGYVEYRYFSRAWEIARTLGNIGDKNAIEPLINTMNKVIGDWCFLVSASKALNKLGDKRGTEILFNKLNSINKNAIIRTKDDLLLYNSVTQSKDDLDSYYLLSPTSTSDLYELVQEALSDQTEEMYSYFDLGKVHRIVKESKDKRLIGDVFER